jgi:hypothetical protein
MALKKLPELKTMINNKIIIPPFLGLLISFYSLSCMGQKDLLSTQRKVFTTDIYYKAQKMSNKEYAIFSKEQSESSKYYTFSKILLPASGLVSVMGTYLAYDAIKGIPKTAIIDGKPIDYTIRSLPKLVIGIATLVGGISLLEFSNDYKVRSVEIMNKEIGKRGQTISFRPKFGLTPNQNLGIYALL